MFLRWRACAALALFAAAHGVVVPAEDAFSSAQAMESLSPPDPDRPLTLGVYDPEKAFRSSQAIGIEHVFVSWYSLYKPWFRSLVRYAERRDRQLFVTVEPFKRPGESATPEKFLKQIWEGEYNPEIRTICRAIGEAGSPVLVRWGHEMDDTSGRYPWAGAKPYAFVRAFRRFVTKCRRHAPEAQFVWSPMASSDPSQYYPGDQYVDYIGLPIWGLQQVDMDYYRRGRSFSELAAKKYGYVAFRNKPVIVAEFGVSGDPSYRQAVLSGIQAARADLPLVAAVVYFNMKEPYPWWGGYGTPDWRVRPRLWTEQAEGAAD